MEIYLPIAQLPVSLFAVLEIGGAVGFLSGMLGVSGGFFGDAASDLLWHSRRHFRLPFKMRFRQSRLYISVIPIITLGAMVGVMTAILGTGGAFILIPAKIYILRMRTTLAVGTSQFQMFMVACITTVLHSVTDHTVDAILGFMLVVGGVVGAHYGSGLGAKLRGEELRAALALLILVIAIRIAVGLLLPPDHIYSIQSALPQHFSWA